MSILSKYKNFLNNSNNKNLELIHHSKKADDIYSMAILQPLLIDYPYIPFTASSLRPLCLAYILNEIIINERKFILEFGMGISTIMIARLIKKNNLNVKIYSVEHNKVWADIINDYLIKEDLKHFVTFIVADLKEIDSPLGMVKWYDYSVIMNKIKEQKFDLIIVDGPPAYKDSIQFSRGPALFNLKTNFEKDFCLILDDAHRIGEVNIIKLFKELNINIKFSIVSDTLAVFRSIENFDPLPIQY